MTIAEEKRKKIQARLELAQGILEDSDRLVGFHGYHEGEQEWWLHPRHEREALVVYLLLTCFDLLGQPDESLQFYDWLQSGKCKDERESAEQKILPNSSPVEVALKLHEEWNKIYGAKRAFYKGIEDLPTQLREKLLSSISVSYVPNYESYPPNTSVPDCKIEDVEKEKKLKMQFIYKTRNEFTHTLKQYNRLSFPIAAGDPGAFCREDIKTNCSWVARIRDDKPLCLSFSYEREKLKNDIYTYSMYDWPFILFKAIYGAISIDFDIFTINLKFIVEYDCRKNEPYYDYKWIGVNLIELKDVKTFLINHFSNGDK